MPTVEVVYAESTRQRVVQVDVAEGGCVADALSEALGLWRMELPVDAGVGIFGEIVERERVLAEGDRVEIYRPLVMDPKAARHERAARQRDLVKR